MFTLFERFNHLGEAYRYLEYCLTFLAPLTVGLSSIGNNSLLLVLASYLSVCMLVIAGRYWRQLRALRLLDPPKDELSQFIDKTEIEGGAVVFPISMRLGPDLVARREDWKSFWWQPGILSEHIYTEYLEEYPFLKRDWRPVAIRHGVTHIICDKRQDSEMKDWQYDFSSEDKIIENENFIAYRVRHSEE